jgi:predicted nucleotidyltransferase
MDPITLFALANGAVAAVKQGCALYKEIASAAGDVKGIIADLDEQFHTKFKDKAPTVAEKNQFIEEKNRIIELSKKQPDDVFTQVGEQLGTYFENMATCMAIFEEEEKHAFDVYTGETSLGKRALQRVLMQTRLVAMEAELRELMVYNCPPEMGDLYNKTQKMMERIKYEQSVAIARKKEKDRKAAIVRAKRLDFLKKKIISWGVVSVLILYFIVLIWSIVEIRKSERPELGVCLIPKGTWGYEQYNNLKWVDCEPK